jgi:hypothetical protein
MAIRTPAWPTIILWDAFRLSSFTKRPSRTTVHGELTLMIASGISDAGEISTTGSFDASSMSQVESESRPLKQINHDSLLFLWQLSPSYHQ